MTLSSINRDPGCPYRGRIAPSPTGFLHLGHAATFWQARERASGPGGRLVLRIEDLDRGRCRMEFRDAIVQDLTWFGIHWDEGPDCGGPHVPYAQSERYDLYISAWKKLRDKGLIYPCSCSRRDLETAVAAPHPADDESVYPGACRPKIRIVPAAKEPAGTAWRFRVPDQEQITFTDSRLGFQTALSGGDFGDFVIWRKDGIPAYQLAAVVDDAAMQITEVVRGEDLLTSTFRQILLYRALALSPPEFYHCSLVKDTQGRRLCKRDGSLSLRALRERQSDPKALRESILSSEGRLRSR